ncbi:Lipid A Biosynthesis N-terminal domain-containing protein [Salegentibacter echinorum]|uniref:Lipid A Biosynthesis N-terminal domain-containing protein n=1 Tax=Salegentibacter echinorum TaxID=1073325 RepID=A0A1M5MFL3_SALEC|nr:lipid-A-disaccharide synthase N-terminal domain-containing protein [Salegentibacter echinorum]SHG76011.1 Lipid A Biosynthesis N-terminal domain-containing protein [Salegentibacter echinorum]
MSSNWYVYAIGFLGQLLFAGRLIMQWLKSEKKEKIATPSLFWKLSLQGAVLLFVYGYLRDDMAIMLGQFLVYGAYFRNLQLQGKWGESGVMFKIYVIGLPILIALYLLFFGQMDWEDLVKGDNISTWLIALGIVGQLIYTFRFIYQWVHAERHQKSDLPWKFWVISLMGSGLIFTYGIFRDDPVLIAAHFFGGIVYIRNLFIIRKSQAKA